MPIYIADHVLEQAGVFFDEDEQPGSAEAASLQEPSAESEPEGEPDLNDDSMSIFRNFINTLDLDNPPKGGAEKS